MASSSSSSRLPNPSADVTMADGSEKRRAIDHGGVLDLVAIFKAQIDAAALSKAKLLAKRANLICDISVKESYLESKNWPQHILQKTRGLSDDLKDALAEQLVRKEIDAISEKGDSIKAQIIEVEKDLDRIIGETLNLMVGDGVLSRQRILASSIDPIREALLLRTIHHTAHFTQTRHNQAREKERRKAAAAAAQASENLIPPPSKAPVQTSAKSNGSKNHAKYAAPVSKPPPKPSQPKKSTAGPSKKTSTNKGSTSTNPPRNAPVPPTSFYNKKGKQRAAVQPSASLN